MSASAVAAAPLAAGSPAVERRPRLGFAGTGWIGGHRLHAVAASGLATVAAVADPIAERRREIVAELARADGTAAPPRTCASFAELLALAHADDGDDGGGLDGVVIATPSGLHAAQATAALDRGLDVFCQKPLGRHGDEVAAVVAAASAAGRRLGVDFCYRHVPGVAELRRVVQEGGLGRVFAVDLVFHNAYGPDKSWALDPRTAGGGCLVDLGTHLLDLCFWCLGERRVAEPRARLYAGGRRLGPEEREQTVEDYAQATLDLVKDASGGESTAVSIHCSWFHATGRPAEIAAVFRGTAGTAELRNRAGSFFDFAVERFQGDRGRESLVPVAAGARDDDPWSWGRGPILDWVAALRDPAASRIADHGRAALRVATAIDRLYGRPTTEPAA